MNSEKTFISIREKGTCKIVRAIDVTGKSERTIQKIIRGIKINMDPKNYYINGR
jgi:hypothetical protein